MTKVISLLGATGSIGRQTLQVARELGLGVAALTANRQAAAMAQAAVASNLNQTLDIQADLTAQVTLDVVVALDDFTQLSSLFFGQVLNAGIRIDTGLSKDLVGRFAANAENVGQADLHALLAGKVNTGNTCHTIITSIVTH